MITDKIADLGDAQLWTTVSGSGPAMVLSHGGPGSFDTLAPVAEMVNDLVTVYRYDQRACGRSKGTPPFSVDRLVDDLEKLRCQWQCDKLIVGGHSWGANLALAYCLKYPEKAKALVYISGPGIIWDWQEQFTKNQNNRLSVEQQKRLSELKKTNKCNELLHLLFTADCAETATAEKLEEFGFFQYPMNWELNKIVNNDWITQSKNIETAVKSLTIPTLIIHGDGDPRPLSIATKMNQLLNDSKLITLPNVGHFPWLEKPQLLRSSLREFLSTLI